MAHSYQLHVYIPGLQGLFATRYTGSIPRLHCTLLSGTHATYLGYNCTVLSATHATCLGYFAHCFLVHFLHTYLLSWYYFCTNDLHSAAADHQRLAHQLFHSWLTSHTFLPSNMPFSVPFCLAVQAVFAARSPVFELILILFIHTFSNCSAPAFAFHVHVLQHGLLRNSFHYCGIGFNLNQAGLMKYYFS